MENTFEVSTFIVWLANKLLSLIRARAFEIEYISFRKLIRYHNHVPSPRILVINNGSKPVELLKVGLVHSSRILYIGEELVFGYELNEELPKRLDPGTHVEFTIGRNALQLWKECPPYALTPEGITTGPKDVLQDQFPTAG